MLVDDESGSFSGVDMDIVLLFRDYEGVIIVRIVEVVIRNVVEEYILYLEELIRVVLYVLLLIYGILFVDYVNGLEIEMMDVLELMLVLFFCG